MDDPGLCPDLGFDPAQPIWSESVALFVTDEDGRAAVSLRACRYPSAGRAWVWMHAMGPDGTWGYNVDHLSCEADRAAIESDHVRYEAGGGTGWFERRGPADAPAEARVTLRVGAHEGLEAPDSAGPVSVEVAASFTPTTAAGGTLPGRTEVFGDASVEVSVAGSTTFTVRGRAQWHEQHQSEPRFVVPFTYASLRGPDQAVVALVGPKRSGGFSRGRGGDRQFTEARFGDVGPDGTCSIALVSDDGAPECTGEAVVRHAIRIPLYGRPWRGTIVAANLDGSALTGSINRWQPS